MVTEQIGQFRGYIAALIRDGKNGRYLLLRRSTNRDVGGGSWECVTGRLNQGDSFGRALVREVREELGIEVRADFIIGTSHFYRGEAIPENEMVGVQYCCTIDNPVSIQVSHEHSESRWLTAEEALALLPKGHWLVKTIERAEALRTVMGTAVIEFNRQHTTEL